MNLWTMAAIAVGVSVGYFLLEAIAPPIAAAALVFGGVMGLLMLGGLFVQGYNTMRMIDGLRRDLAQWMRDPRGADPEDSYLARLAKHIRTK